MPTSMLHDMIRRKITSEHWLMYMKAHNIVSKYVELIILTIWCKSYINISTGTRIIL